MKWLKARTGADAGSVARGTHCGHPLTCPFPYVFTFSYVPRVAVIVTSRGQPPPRESIPGIRPRSPHLAGVASWPRATPCTRSVRTPGLSSGAAPPASAPTVALGAAGCRVPFTMATMAMLSPTRCVIRARLERCMTRARPQRSEQTPGPGDGAQGRSELPPGCPPPPLLRPGREGDRCSQPRGSCHRGYDCAALLCHIL